jgi:hypothetical protein
MFSSGGVYTEKAVQSVEFEVRTGLMHRRRLSYILKEKTKELCDWSALRSEKSLRPPRPVLLPAHHPSIYARPHVY